MQESGNQSETSDAIILCGGLSKRMGKDKAWLAVNGEFFLNRLTGAIPPLVRRLVVVKAAGQNIPKVPDQVLVVDDEVPEEGPLSGFVTGLKHLHDSSDIRQPVWLASCDSPFFSVPVFWELRSRLSDYDAAMVVDAEFIHPFSAWYGPTSQDVLIESFEAGQRSLTRVLNQCNCQHVPSYELNRLDSDLQFLRSVNTAEDLEWAESVWPN